MPLEDLRAWLFPPSHGTWHGEDLGLLDPGDAADRAALIRADHPDLHEATGPGDGALDLRDDPSGPRLHLMIHEVVATQLWEGDPSAVGTTANRLRALGYDRHEVLHMLGTVVAEDLWRVGRGQAVLDRNARQDRLDALPGSWEEGPGVPASDNSDADMNDTYDTYDTYDTLDTGDDTFDEELLVAAHEVLTERGPLDEEALAELLGTEVEDLDLVIGHPSLTVVADGRVASALAALRGAALTHRVTTDEAARGSLDLGTDLAPLEAFLCSAGHLHLAGGTRAELEPSSDAEELDGDRVTLKVPPPDLRTGDVVGFQVPEDVGWIPELEMVRLDAAPPASAEAAICLARGFELLSQGEPLPVRSIDLLCQMALDASAMVAGILPPLDELFQRAGFEARHAHAAPQGADWGALDQRRRIARLCARRGLDSPTAAVVLTVVEAFRSLGEAAGRAGGGGSDLSRQAAEVLAVMVTEPEVAEAFAEATVDQVATVRAVLRTLRRSAGRRYTAGVLWVESLVSGRAGDTEAAESCLRAALAAHPGDHLLDQILEDCAWHASDRGDAAAAVRFLERTDARGEDSRLTLLRTVARPPVPRAGRNAPCPCGSGRKYKLCCLAREGTALATPLPTRTRWVWEKLRWWLERFGPFATVIEVALALHGRPRVEDVVALAVDMDIAASLVLFGDGAVQSFLSQRGAILPADEADLVSQWALAPLSVFEVTDAVRGEGLTLRDLRTEDVTSVRERHGAKAVTPGDLLLTHPVFDGTGYQIVGGIVGIPLRLRDPLLEALDEGAGARQLAQILGSGRQAARHGEH